MGGRVGLAPLHPRTAKRLDSGCNQCAHRLGEGSQVLNMPKFQIIQHLSFRSSFFKGSPKCTRNSSNGQPNYLPLFGCPTVRPSGTLIHSGWNIASPGHLPSVLPAVR